jgi:Mrp family chromosome partitioning ATPase
VSPNSTQPASDEGDGAFAPFRRAARAHPWLIAAVTLVALAAGVLWAAQRTRHYEATAQVLVTPLAGGGSYTGLPILTDSVDPTRILQTAASVLDSPTAAAATARQVPGWSAQRVGDAVDVTPLGQSNIVTVTATADDPVQAARIANSFAESTLATRSGVLRRGVTASIAGLRAQQKALDPADTATATEIARELSDLQRIEGGQDPNFSLLQAAGDGVATGSPRSLIAILALLAGGVIGLGAALLVEHLNRRVRDEDELLQQYPLPVLARVPSIPPGGRDVISPELLPPRVQEAFRTLQVQLDHGREGNRAVMLTSPSMGDGKTTCAINLAMALTSAGADVILMDLDLRKPEVGNRLGAHSDLSGLFQRDATLESALVAAPTVPGLRLLATRAQENAMPLLEAVTRRLPQMLAEARRLADYVIVDTPPLGEVSDALRTAGVVDDIVLVARPGHTDRGNLIQARELLDRLGHVPTGLLLVGVASAGTLYYGYGVGTPVPER